MTRSRAVLAIACVIAAATIVVGVAASDSGNPATDRATTGATGRQAAQTSKSREESRPHEQTSERRNPYPDAPRLIGTTPDKARRLLASRGIEDGKVEKVHIVGDGCPDVSPGRVIWQSADPGHNVPGDISLMVSDPATCSEAIADAPCRTDQLSLEAEGYGSDFPGSAGQRSVHLEVTNEGRRRASLTRRPISQ